MKATAMKADELARRPPLGVRVFLAHGENAGMASDWLRGLRAVAGSGGARWLSSREASSRGALEEALATGSLFGEEARAVMVRGATDATAGAMEGLLEEEAGWARDARVFLEAGTLRGNSRLRRLVERHELGLSLYCAADTAATALARARRLLEDAGATVDEDATALLSSRLGGDRGANDREVEKLALWAGKGGRVTLEGALALVGDVGGAGADDLASAAFLGDVGGTERALRRLESAGGLSGATWALLRAARRTLSATRGGGGYGYGRGIWEEAAARWGEAAAREAFLGARRAEVQGRRLGSEGAALAAGWTATAWAAAAAARARAKRARS